MYQNYIFDLYGTLVDIKTNEKKSYLWEKTALVFSLRGAPYTKKELRKRCKELVAKQKEVTEKISLNEHNYEKREIQLFQVCKELYQEKGVDPSESQIMDICLFFRAISLEHLSLYEGADLLLKRLKNNGKRIYSMLGIGVCPSSEGRGSHEET